ncbi:TonB-dependent siderophore receptor [Herbaspirillum chlorophenolicum]|uniref:TonB-dependent siderophore receptor n=1 Tax=Herbaspirillum chlorophenolicum TaxID=211589 RepID=UPI00067B6D1E|nr:TonB-dependent siderophore receptor [Herbaspirillum chlorophenolicum]
MHRFTPSASPRRSTLLRLNVLAAAILLAASSYAQTAKVNVDIPAEPLDRALNALARQTGIQIFFASGLAKDRTAPALKGSYTAREALDRLLSGSGLEVREQADKTFTVQAAGLSKNETQLPAVTVSGEREESAYGPVQGYVATRSATATKTDSSILETPQSISVITRDRYEAQGAQSVNEALRYSAAVSSYGAGTRSDWYTVVRGFVPSVYLDGLQLPTTINLASWRVDPYQLERIELLRGPASVLYGQGDPGGTVNMVSKLPTAQPLHELEMQVGTNSRRQLAGDFSGKLDEDGKLLYRFTGLARDSNLPLGPFKDQRLMLAPSLTWMPDTDTTLTLQLTYLRDRTNASDSFLPASGTILPNPNGKISSTLFTGSPDWDHYVKEQYSVGYLFEHRFNDTWTVRQNLRWSKVKLDDQMTYGVGLDPADATQSTMLRDAYLAKFDYYRLALDNQAQAKFSTGAIAHTALAGVDFQRQRKNSLEYDVLIPGSFNLYHPVYPRFDTSIFDGATPGSSIATQEQVGVYLQDQIKFDKHWILTVGGRKDWTKSVVDDLVANTSQSQKDSAYTGRIGLVYLDESGLAPYVSYSTSFMPELGRDSSNNMFKPTTGKQLEAGVKYQPGSSKTSITASVFEIKQQNVTTVDLNDPSGNSYVQTGEVRSRGFELEAVAEINRNLNVIASYTYQDVKNTKTNDPTTLNKWPIDIPRPRQMASLWLDYTLRGGALSGLGFGGGVRYVSSNAGSPDNSLSIPGYALFDAALHYDLPSWRLSLTGSNLFNRDYVTGCYYDARCIYGNGRQVLATARYRW